MKGGIQGFFIAQRKLERLNPFVPGAILVTAYLLFFLSAYNYTNADGDLAEYLNNPLRVINGELPYRDFWLLFPPGEVFLPAFIYKIFGLNINAVLVLFVVIRSLVGIFSFLLGRTIFRNNFLAVISSLLVVFNGAASCYFLFLLISALFFISYLRNNSNAGLLFSGVFAGLAALFEVFLAGAAALAIIVTIIFHPKADKKSLNHSIKSIAAFCSGILSIIGIASLLLAEILMPMAKEIFVESVSHNISMALPYFCTIKDYIELVTATIKNVMDTGSLRYIADLLCQLSSLIVVTLSYILPFIIGCVCILCLQGKALEREDKVPALFFFLWGLFTFPKALGRSDVGHALPSLTPLFFLMIFLLQKKRCLAHGFMVIIYLLLLTVPLSFINKVHILLMPHYEVSTQYGTLLFGDKSAANEATAVIDFIKNNTEEGDYIFVTPWFAPPFYSLTNRRNPAYYDSMIDLMARSSKKKQIEVCNDLLNNPTKVIIHYADWGFDNKKEQHFLNSCPLIQRCIEDNFKLREKYGCYWIYVPKNAGAIDEE